jgi:hypothetical protein
MGRGGLGGDGGDAAQEESFEAVWNPMFAYPAPECVDYLNFLNPLLGQYLSVRAASAQTALEFDEEWREAHMAAVGHFESGVREALAIANHRKILMQSLAARMKLVAAAIRKLGDPPDPGHCRAQKRKQQNDAVKQTKELLRKMASGATSREAPEEEAPHGVWVQTKVTTTQEVHCRPSMKAKVSGDNMSMTIELSGTHPVVDQDTGKDNDRPVSVSWKLKWDRPPTVYDPHKPWPSLKASVENAGLSVPDKWSYIDKRHGDWCSAGGIHGSLNNGGEEKGLMAGGVPGMPEVWEGKRHTGAGWHPSAEGHFNECLYGLHHEPTDKDSHVATYTLRGYANVSVNQVFVVKTFTYEWDPTGKLRPADAQTPDEHGAVEVTLSLANAKTPEEIAQVKEEIAMREEFVKVLQDNLRWSQEQLAKITDPDGLDQMLQRIVGEQASLQAEHDVIAALETGKFAHTRTAWDEAASACFVEKCYQEVAKLEADKRRYDGMQRMIGHLSPEEAEEMRAFINRNITPKAIAGMDRALMRKMTDIVCQKTMGYLEGQAAKAEAEAVEADHDLAYVQSVKSTCDNADFILGLGGGHSVMVAYSGLTGFIEGPPPKDGQATDPSLGWRFWEGAKRGLMWINTATFVAAEAMEGYEKGGYVGGPGNNGAWGAVERAGEALVMAKTIEFCAGKVFGTGSSADKAAQQAVELENWQAGTDGGRALVEDYQKTYQQYQKAMDQRALNFGASSEELATLERQLQQKAAYIHSVPEAKLVFKQMGKDGKALDAIDDYLLRMSRNHLETQSEFLKIMKSGGYENPEAWDMRDMRNASSAGSVGMDHDMAIFDQPGGFVKNGVHVSPGTFNAEAQRAWDQAYKKITGRSATRSWETITTSSHWEAYRDLAWLGDPATRKIRVNEICGSWTGQAGDVTAAKAYDILGNPSYTRLQGIVEASRGMAKDINTKVLGVLEGALERFPASAGKIRGNIDRWRKVAKILDTATRDPIEADRRLRELTGKNIPEIVNDVRDMIASYGKAVGK